MRVATALAAAPLSIGGQAVIEGVMMRSPHSFAVAVRRADGRLVVREAPWRSLWDRLTFLRWPFLRGAVVLIESLHNGMSALGFSANQAAEDEAASETKTDAEGTSSDGSSAEDKPAELSKMAISLTVAASLALGLVFFLVLPHFLTWAIGLLTGIASLQDGQSAAFHAVDGTIKLTLFVTYVWAISKIPDIHRVFQYHGAEHKAIFTYESGEELTVENARKFTTLHPRCGTSFILIVVMMSILVFFAVLPWVPPMSDKAWLNQVLLILVKLPLMFPIAGLAYEVQRLSAKTYGDHPIVRALIWPGLMLQRITTKPPSDDQLEVALVSVRKVLLREEFGERLPNDVETDVEDFASFEDFMSRAA